MRHWGHNRSQLVIDETEPAKLRPTHIANEINELRSRHIETVGAQEHISSNEALARLFCHWAIDLVPREGMAELVEKLLEIISFYSDRKPALDVLSLPGKSLKAKISSNTVRPTFSITEDE